MAEQKGGVALAQECLVLHLTDAASLHVLAMEGVDTIIIPDETLRPVVTFALEYYGRGGNQKAPSVAAVLAEADFADVLNDAEIDLDAHPEDTIEWALDTLRKGFLFKQVARFNRTLATEMAEPGADRFQVVADASDELVAISMAVETKMEGVDIREAMGDRLAAYRTRAANRDVRDGMTFGLGLIDDYTNGIHPGELAVLAAGPKVGKSFFLDMAALRDWQAGKLVGLFTLENSIEMTLDRIACMATGVSYRAFQRGLLEDHHVERIERWITEMQDSPNAMYVRRPPLEKRRVSNIVRDAQLRGCESLYIDQLSHIRHADPKLSRNYQIGESLRELADLIASGRGRMPCLLAHQINREGVKAAQKRGHYVMEDMAESGDTEKVADWVFGLYQSFDQRSSLQALFQTMAARRDDLRHFSMLWNVDAGHFVARAETQLG